jgi:hypothetical protein
MCFTQFTECCQGSVTEEIFTLGQACREKRTATKYCWENFLTLKIMKAVGI